MSIVKVIVCGSCGKMGREAIKTVSKEENLELVGAVDLDNTGKDIGLITQNQALEIYISNDLEFIISNTAPQVMIDFTAPAVVKEHIYTALQNNVVPVVGTTGLTNEDIEEINTWVHRYETGAIIAPNFALGAILMMKFSSIAARFLPQVEIIELHHDQKIDAPSGTALKTAQMIKAEQVKYGIGDASDNKPEEIEKLNGARGGKIEDIHIHSIRLQGKVAHQEVIFGGKGQTLSIRHDSLDRSSFMPGLVMAIKEAVGLKKLIYGLENLIEF